MANTNIPLDIKGNPIELKPGQRILASGVIYDANIGRIVKRVAPDPYAITKENTREFTRRRKEKAAALLRQKITETHNASMPSPVTSSAGAFAEAGAMLYEQIVLNSEAYPRDRMDAWQKLGQYAEVIGDTQAQGTPVEQVTDMLEAGSKLLALLRDTIQPAKEQIHETIDGVIEGSARE